MVQSPDVKEVHHACLERRYDPFKIEKKGNTFTIYIRGSNRVTSETLARQFDADSGYECIGHGKMVESENYFFRLLVRPEKR